MVLAGIEIDEDPEAVVEELGGYFARVFKLPGE